MKTKVLIVDDHKTIRDGLRKILQFLPEIEVIGEAENGAVAGQKAKLLSPDLIFMDLSLPQISGLDAMKMIKQQNPNVNIIVVSVHTEPTTIELALQSGAQGYVSKCDFREIAASIRSVLSGDTFLSSSIQFSLD